MPKQWDTKELTVMLFFLSHGFKTKVVSSLMAAVCKTPEREIKVLTTRLHHHTKKEEAKGFYQSGRTRDGYVAEWDRELTYAYLVSQCKKQLKLSDEAAAREKIEDVIHLKPEHLQILRGDKKAFKDFARERPDLVDPQDREAAAMSNPTVEAGDAFRPQGMQPMLTSLAEESLTVPAYASTTIGTGSTYQGGRGYAPTTSPYPAIGTSGAYPGGSGYGSATSPYTNIGAGSAYQGGRGYGPATSRYTNIGAESAYQDSGRYPPTLTPNPGGELTWQSSEEPAIDWPPLSPLKWPGTPTPSSKAVTRPAKSSHNPSRRIAPEDDEPGEAPQPRKRHTGPLGAQTSPQSGPRQAQPSLLASEGTTVEDKQIARKWSKGEDMDEAACERWAMTLGSLPEFDWAWQRRNKVNDDIHAEHMKKKKSPLWSECDVQDLAYWQAQFVTLVTVGSKMKYHSEGAACSAYWKRCMAEDPKFEWVKRVRHVKAVEWEEKDAASKKKNSKP